MKTCVTPQIRIKIPHTLLLLSITHFGAQNTHKKRERIPTSFIHCFDLPKKEREEDEKSFEQRERSRVSETFVIVIERGEEKIFYFLTKKKIKNRTLQVFTQSESVGFLESNQILSFESRRLSHSRYLQVALYLQNKISKSRSQGTLLLSLLLSNSLTSNSNTYTQTHTERCNVESHESKTLQIEYRTREQVLRMFHGVRSGSSCVQRVLVETVHGNEKVSGYEAVEIGAISS